jgi:RNA polymerase sigma factor (sigma-70 family)
VINDQLEKLYIKYYRELYLYAFSLCKNHHLAQDLTSDTFFKAYLSLDDDVEYFKYWIFRVCKNLYFDFLRKEKEYSSENKLEDIIFNNETPLDKIIESEEKKRLYSLVINLRESYREILILYYYCGFSIEEISKSRDITESAAKTLLFRARKKLKNALEGENEL